MLFNKLFNRKCIFVVLKDTGAIFYGSTDQASEPLLTIQPYDRTVPELAEFILKNKSVRTSILLDVPLESREDIEIPNIEAVNIHEALQERLGDDIEKYKIVQPLVLNKPEATDPTWKFTVAKFSPSKQVIEFIEHLIHELDAVTGVYILPNGQSKDFSDAISLDVLALKKLNLVYMVYKAMHGLFIMATLVIIALISQKELNYFKVQKQLAIVNSEIQSISNRSNEELDLQAKRFTIFDRNRSLKRLYKAFSKEQYPIDVLHAVTFSKSHGLVINRFVYGKDNTVTMSIGYSGSKNYKYNEYFNEVNKLISSLKNTFPHHRILSHRVSKRFYAQGANSIDIKIIGPIEVANDR